ncbi:MAG: ATP-binding protein [Treponema sp.]|nr:ATP-binding protein [Treponema sp.]MCL2250571.1 ATP-binding protein [Treponema sp.]
MSSFIRITKKIITRIVNVILVIFALTTIIFFCYLFINNYGNFNLQIFSGSSVVIVSLLVWFMLHTSIQKANSEERIQLMLNATPMCVTFWDKNKNVIECNQNAVDMFKLSGKDEYKLRFFDLIPEFQSDGTPSKNILVYNFNKAMETGYHRFEWLHQMLDGEPIPCEVTLIRDKFKDDFIILGYTRDLREVKKIIKEMDQRARLLDIVNTAATILLSGNETISFEKTLMASFDLVGKCLDVDRVQIWRNELIGGDLHFALRYEWLSDYGKTCSDVPYGLHFPYRLKKNWETLFLQGEVINGPLSQLSEEDRDFLGYYDIKSVVMIPMFLNSEFWGFFRIDDCRHERTFPPEEINILTSAGLMMTTAANRNLQSIKMREADERTQIMIDAAPLCAIFWDNNSTLIDCNQETVKMFGLQDKQEFISKFEQLSPEYQPDGIPSSEKVIQLVGKAFEEGYSRFEWMHQKLDGELIPAEIICVRVKHKNKFTVTEYIRDLREQRAKITEMRKAEIAEESSKAKSEFLAKMSHEIRTPMNAILGITEIQLQDDSLPKVTKEALERIYNSGDLLLGIINDILDLSKIEAGKLTLIPDQYDIASLIHDTVQLNIMRYESKPIDFKLEVDANIPVLLLGDELRIKQILNNLLSNAFKYTDKGTVTLKLSCEPCLNNRDSNINNNDQNDITIVFTVCDTGQGMTAEQVSKLGSEYSRFNMEANRKTEGTGLGMNITRNLIRLMKGELHIESTPGMGSVFTVHLPQQTIDDEIIGKELADNLMKLNLANTVKIRTVQIKREFMPYGRVLIVDDVETNLYVAKGLMAPYGLSIDTAASAFEAIDKIRSGSLFDIIFMDHMMPGMDGIEATKIIRNLGYKKPIVALTANALAGQAEMFLNSGFDDFISKPIDIRQLNITLNKLVRDKMPSDVVQAARKQKEKLFGGSVIQSSVDLQLAEFFVRDARKTLKILEMIYTDRCRSDEDISAFVINIHAIKSALANVGEVNLSADAAKLEQAGRDKNIKLILTDLPFFLEKLFLIIEKFEYKVKSHETKAKGNLTLLKEKLLVIKNACIEFDKKAAKDILTELRNQTWSSEVEEWFGTVAEYLLHSDFDEAVKNIEEYIKKI